MVQAVVEKTASLEPDIILDLYCGAGNFTIPLAQKFPEAQVIGVEANPVSSEAGRERGKLLQNLQLITGDTAIFLKKQTPLPTKSVAVIDPPRAGAESAVITSLKKLGPSKILYVSCHPATAKRDILLFEPEYTLTRITSFDMFPQTDHVELIAELDASPRLD
ncbi:MAG: methyltransferase domain-containing protein, partial [Bdellovibrionia bacterium]